jgi:hypothetical protein
MWLEDCIFAYTTSGYKPIFLHEYRHFTSKGGWPTWSHYIILNVSIGSYVCRFKGPIKQRRMAQIAFQKLHLLRNGG